MSMSSISLPSMLLSAPTPSYHHHHHSSYHFHDFLPTIVIFIIFGILYAIAVGCEAASSRNLDQPRTVVIDIQPAGAAPAPANVLILQPHPVVIDIQPPAPAPAPADVSNPLVPNYTLRNIAPIIMYNSTSSSSSLAESNNCAICFEGLGQGPEVMGLSQCKHSFHKECINEWIKSKAGDHNTCPICRTLISV